MNTTTFAIDALGLEVTAPDQPLTFENVVGIGVRNNPRRAHLLVSTLLGKHTPQRPDIIDAAARLLGTRASDALRGRPDRISEPLAQLNQALEHGLRAPRTPRTADRDVIVIGFAEAASALGAIAAQHLGAYYICSTRTPQREAYGHFLEAHSHAADHYLTPSDPSTLDDTTKPVILIDDELTTGHTVMNTIRALHAHAPHPQYVVATLADLRDEQSRSEMFDFVAEIGVPVSVVSLFEATVTVPADAITRAQPLLTSPPEEHAPTEPLRTAHTTVPFAFAGTAHERDGVPHSERLLDAAFDIWKDSPVQEGERVLVLGVEEDMALGLTAALALQLTGHDVHYSSTTRSPAAVRNESGYPLRDGVTFTGPDGEPRFIYNIAERFDHIIVVSADPLYAAMLPAIARSLEGHTRMVTIATPRTLQQPLAGPTFGSYAPDDVKWLLKDLSGLALEVSLEDREERVQGGAHYAESLPQEYQPSEKYMALYAAALHENAGRVAHDIAVVAHRIMAARTTPVLVSLARAGTPVGVLLRRYLRQFCGYEAPHYAVSIVRGKGIDANALSYIADHHDPKDVIFVDGWTGKGAITRELKDALVMHEDLTGQSFPSDVAVLADTGDCTTIYGTRDDYLIPSAALNSTVSGLVSRTVLTADLIGPNDYHGAKFYAELADADVSSAFIDTIEQHFTDLDPDTIPLPVTPGWASWAEVERISDEYGIGQMNLVKPGVGETTRVLLRRVPWRILLNPDAGDTVAHIRALADARGVPIEEVPGLRFNAVGLIHPKFTKSSTGADGRAASMEKAA